MSHPNLSSAGVLLICALGAFGGAATGQAGKRHEIEQLGLSFELSPAMQAKGAHSGRYVFQVGEPPESRVIVIRELEFKGNVDDYAAKRRENHVKGPGLELRETLRSVDGERAFSWVETKVALNSREFSCVFVNPMTDTLTRVELKTVLEERPGVRTIPPSPRDGAPSKADVRAIHAYTRLVESLDLTKRRRRPKGR